MPLDPVCPRPADGPRTLAKWYGHVLTFVPSNDACAVCGHCGRGREEHVARISASGALTHLLDIVHDGWPIDHRGYPSLPPRGSQPGVVRAATAAHVCLHLSKQAGKLAALHEPLLHGELPPAQADVARQVAYTIIDALRLALLAGVDGDEIEAVISAWHAEQAIRGPAKGSAQ